MDPTTTSWEDDWVREEALLKEARGILSDLGGSLFELHYDFTHAKGLPVEVQDLRDHLEVAKNQPLFQKHADEIANILVRLGDMASVLNTALDMLDSISSRCDSLNLSMDITLERYQR